MNQVYFNLGDLFKMDGKGNLALSGDQDFKLELMGPSVGDSIRSYTLTLGTNFVVAQAEGRSFVLDSLTLVAGFTNTYSGQNGSIPVNMIWNVGITSVVATIETDLKRLTNWTVEALGIKHWL